MRFHEVMAEESGQSVVAVPWLHILPLVPGIGERLEGRRSVLDLGCGSGRALMLAERFPSSTFQGYDLSPDAVAYETGQAPERISPTSRSSSAI